METGETFPDFVLQDENGDEFDSKQLKGKRYVIYFYPKDNTSGCTREAIGFSEKLDDFEALGIQVIGVSKDTVASHRKFVDSKELRIKLLSDPDHVLLEASGVWGTKIMYGKETTGTIRSTFIVGKDGKVEAAWKKVKVDGHVDKVLEKARSLS
ncbi:MAG: peroxiredoxin [Candidatus Methanomethylophilaceae archaeon]|nr:peroxiredoxin [Candidatus Methanomethylophilaceae archaeon]